MAALGVGREEGQGPDARITISVDPDTGNFTYTPTHIRVVFTDVKTSCVLEFKTPNDEPFEVMFKDRTPGNKMHLNERDRDLTITNETPAGLYPYAAALSVKGRTFIDVGCGDISVAK
ncbi:MAG: hypothetical protein DMG59_00715 [Acidobacteria bacterium]|jgi:hypothetical protein|nr:MAG: hypothetical protein DMG59_00715 [Acidobacteriota bacterium]